MAKKRKKTARGATPVSESDEEKLARLERENAALRRENETLEDGPRNPKKSGGLLREGKRVKFSFIHAEKASFPVAALCRVLGVTRQGYYAFVKRPPSSRVVEEDRLRERLKQLHVESRQTYGSPRMLRALRAEGVRVSKRRIERALRALELRVKLRRRTRRWVR